MRKEENAGNKHFLLFPQCFLHVHTQISLFLAATIISSANALNLEKSLVFLFDKEL